MNSIKIKVEGLTCANCGAKIEKDTKSIFGDENVFLNILNQEMEVKTNDNHDNTLKTVKTIVNKYEPDVKVYEINTSKPFIITLKGLNCANCASKIETASSQIDFVKSAQLNFMNKEMSITIDDGGSKIDVYNKIKNIVNKLEPDVEVSIKENNSHEHTHCHDGSCSCGEHEHTEKKSFDFPIKYRFISGGILFILASFISRDNNFGVLFYILSYIIFGYDVIITALKNIFKGNVFDENFLMSVSTIGAIILGELPEAVFVMFFYQVGETFQHMAVEKSRKSIRSLMDLRPDKVNVEIDGKVLSTSPENVSIGDIVVVKPGERIALDGVVIYGESRLDTSAITGESVPRGVGVNDEVLSGTINLNGVLKIKATKTFGESTVVKILELVENASAKKSKTEQFITKFARVYTPAVVFGAIALAFIPSIITPEKDLSIWVMRALTFLVISCPCALVLSVPLGFFSGIGEASKNGILVKGSSYMTSLSEIETVVFDKTGTITEGVFKVSHIEPYENIDSKNILSLAYTVEKMSNHPIAISISEYCKNNDIDIFECTEYEEISGMGIKAVCEKGEILAGNEKLMKKYNVPFVRNNYAGSVVYISLNGKFMGSLNVSDIIKPDSYEAIKKLKNVGVKNIVMLTGDTDKNARDVSKELNIDNYYAELLPQDKVSKLEEILSKSKGKTAFIGDGVNDAPVLARADIGVAMGGIGSDSAIEASDVVIMNDCVSKLYEGIQIAKNTIKIVNMNIVFAIGVKLIVLVLGALGIAGMWAAVFADVGVAVIAVLNSMRKKLK